MSRRSVPAYVEKTVRLLVEHFGAGDVRAALAKVSGNEQNPVEIRPGVSTRKSVGKPNPNTTIILHELEKVDKEKHALLAAFYVRLKNREVLKESQDIRQFALVVGIKDLRGKSRRDLLPTLMRFLSSRQTEQLKADLARASTVSEAHRQQGFSVLTDKLLGEK